MRFQIILALGLVALAGATPLVDKRHGSLKVVDIPADLFAEESENVETVQAPEDKPLIGADEAAAAAIVPDEKTPSESVEPLAAKEDDKKEAAAAAADVATQTDSDDKVDEKKPVTGEEEEGDRPSFFGFRLPTIVIVRRPAPAIFDDPFSNFFPFSFPSFSRRPAFGPPPPSVNREVEIRDGEERPVVAAASPSQQRPVSVGGSSQAGIADVMHNVRQHMDSLFSSLFAPNTGFFPNRQFFPRPMFPPVPVDSSAEEDSLDFDKLPDNYKNSTHETKVVDGKVVEVNRTVHKISGNNSNGFFQFSVIKIRPSDSPITEEAAPPAAIEEKNSESAAAPEVTTIKAQQEAEMNNPSLNEVDQQSEKEKLSNTKYETDPGLLEEPKSPSAPVSLPLTQEVVYDFVPLQSMPLIEATKSGQGKKPHDLSSDLRVNNLMATQENVRLRTLVDPDEVEVIEL